MAEPPCLVDVYVARVDHDELDVVNLTKLLSAEEQVHAARLHHAYCRRYTICRAALRQILAARLAVAPRSLAFINGPNGKPQLPGGPSFNLAHSGEWAVIAVGVGTLPLGVDIERIRPERPVSGLISRFLSSSERGALERLGGEQLVEAFYWCWTAKEAYLKALGVGLSAPLDSFDVSVDLTAPAELLSHRGALIGCSWTLRRLQVADGYAATLAVGTHECEVRCQRWTPGWESTARARLCT